MIKKTIPTSAPRVGAAIDGRIMHCEPRTEAILLTISPGEEIPMHKNPFDVLFAGIRGKASLISSSITETIEAAETIFVTAGEDRAWKNETSQPAQILVIKIFNTFD